MNRKFSMAVKLALVGLAAAGAAQAQTLNSGIDGTPGDLFLVVFDVTTGQTYVEDLGIQTTNIWSASTVTSAVSSSTAGHVSSALPAYNDTESLDSTLSAVLGSGNTLEWEVVAANNANGMPNFVLSSANAAAPGTFTNSYLSNTNVNSMASNMGNDIDNWSLNNTFTLNGKRPNSSFTGFSNNATLPGQSGDAGALTWYGNSGINPISTVTGSGKTSSAQFYMAANSGGAVDLGDLLGLGTVTLNESTDQLIFAGSSVPVPAGLWLLGSGLMGLVGIARRRRVAA